MRHLPIALLLAVGCAAAPAAFAQAGANEGPKALPKAETAVDAEHAPTQGNTASNAATKAERNKPTAGKDPSKSAKDEVPRSKDDAEHAPTRPGDEGKDTRRESDRAGERERSR